MIEAGLAATSSSPLDEAELEAVRDELPPIAAERSHQLTLPSTLTPTRCGMSCHPSPRSGCAG